MERLRQVKKYESKMDALFLDLFMKFNKCPITSREKLPTYGGIYVFYKHSEPIYVGRTDNIRNRIQLHTRQSSGNGSATFAFNLAKRDYEKRYKKITATRTELEKDKDFKRLFIERKKYLFDCEYKFLKLENDILQTMFEPYLAYKLGTYHINNTFENH